jgi:hypothetical protein
MGASITTFDWGGCSEVVHDIAVPPLVAVRVGSYWPRGVPRREVESAHVRLCRSASWYGSWGFDLGSWWRTWFSS